jgi:hypothetical protein
MFRASNHVEDWVVGNGAIAVLFPYKDYKYPWASIGTQNFHKNRIV